MELRAAIFRYCNYQERSHQEVKDKLYGLGAHTEEVNNLIVDLIETGLLNEERFVRSFVRGKFKLKHWGKVKIIQHLKEHRISDYLIKKAVREEIDPSGYFASALRLGERKWGSLAKNENKYMQKAKVYRYLLQKGYESSIITEVIQVIQTLE